MLNAREAETEITSPHHMEILSRQFLENFPKINLNNIFQKLLWMVTLS